MKRSEMKIKIEQAIKSCFQGPSVVPDKVLEAVLEACEENGMLPPRLWSPFQEIENNPYQWEPEND